jgi:hypothetical protein
VHIKVKGSMTLGIAKRSPETGKGIGYERDPPEIWKDIW